MQTELEFEQGIIKFLTEIGGSKQWQYVHFFLQVLRLIANNFARH